MVSMFNNLKRKAYSLVGIVSMVSIMGPACSDDNSQKDPTFTYVPSVELTETLLPTDTSTAIPSTDTPVPATPTLKEIATPEPTEEKSSNVVKNLENRANEIRAIRAQNDPDYMNRINPELAENYVTNILFLGKKDGRGPPDTYIVMSFKDNMEIDVTALSRDFYTPESNRRINSYLGYPEDPVSGDWYIDLIQPSLIPLVENITGLPIDYYVMLSSEKLIVDMAEVFGGLDVKMPKSAYDEKNNIQYEKGETYRLEGELLRYFIVMRKSDGADQRLDRQVLIGKTIFKTLLSDVKSKPVRGFKEMVDLYKLINQYETEGQLLFNTSTPEIDQDFKGMYDLGVAFLKDAALGKAEMPDIGNSINIGSLGLFRPWGSDPSDFRRYYRSAIDEQYEIYTDAVTNMEDLVHTYVGSEPLLAITRDQYYFDLRQKIADKLLEN